MKARRLNKRANKRNFTKTASATNGKNILGRYVMRGGQRL